MKTAVPQLKGRLKKHRVWVDERCVFEVDLAEISLAAKGADDGHQHIVFGGIEAPSTWCLGHDDRASNFARL